MPEPGMVLRKKITHVSNFGPSCIIFNFCEFYFCFLCSVDLASLYNLVNETNLVHVLFLVYFVNFIYKL